MRGTARGPTMTEFALDALSTDQRALFDALDRGFGDRREVVVWCHRCSVRTAGMLPDGWAASLLGDRYRMGALLDADARPATDHAADERRARLERELLGDDTLRQACRRGLRFMSGRATDYADKEAEGGSIDTERQRHVGMRPLLDDVARRQRAVLLDALGCDEEPGEPVDEVVPVGPGLRGRRDISRWTDRLVRACRGADGGLSRETPFSPYWRSALLDDPSRPSLHLLLADRVLSEFNQVLREAAWMATESAARESAEHGSFNT